MINQSLAGKQKEKAAVIYMCYDGILEPLGESQVVAYLERLATSYKIYLISFEKSTDLARHSHRQAMASRLHQVGIGWYPQRYHKRPKILSTLWDMVVAMVLATWLSLKYDARLLHARSVLSAAVLYPARLLGRGKFLVDIRGFWADERVDGGMINANGPIYKALKIMERSMLRSADHVVTLTHASISVLRKDPRLGQVTAPITVIPTCADLTLFSPGAKDRSRPLVIGYAGQVGTWYMLDEMLLLFTAIQRHRRNARLLVVNTHQQPMIYNAASRVGINLDALEVVAAGRADMPTQMRRMDVGLALIHPFFSKIASAPTKFAEYLGCGIPVVGNVGCGDMADIIQRDRVGVVMKNTRLETIEATALELLDELNDKALADRCVASAQHHFALEKGVRRYQAIYQSLTDSAS